MGHPRIIVRTAAFILAVNLTSIIDAQVPNARLPVAPIPSKSLPTPARVESGTGHVVETGTRIAQAIARDLNGRSLGEIKRAYLLAFQSEGDDRQFYLDSALVAFELASGKWELAHAFRHPDGVFTGWQLYYVNDAPDIFGERIFDKIPSESEVDEFLRDTRWEFSARDGFSLVRGVVYTVNWERAFGRTCSHGYPTSRRTNHVIGP